MDNSNPQISSESPDGADSETEPDIEATFEDSNTGLEEAWISFDASGDDVNESVSPDGSDSETVNIDFGDNDFDSLDDGSYEVEYYARDQADNVIQDSWSFTVDTTEPDPSNINLKDDDGDEIEEGNFDVSDRDEFPVEAEFEASSDHSSTVTAQCVGNGEEDYGSKEFDDLSSGDTASFTCDIDEDEFGSTVDFEFKLTDEAGHEWSSDSYELGLDDSPPRVYNVESVAEASTFSSSFELNYEASDTVAGVDRVFYELGGEEFDVEESPFSVDTSGLESGGHTVKVYAEDSLGMVSDAAEFEFDYRPDESAQLSVSADSSLAVETGSSESLEVTVENTGKVPARGVQVNCSKFAESKTVDLISPGSSKTVEISLDPGKEALGNHSVTLNAGSASSDLKLDVNAGSELQASLDESLEEERQRFESMKSKVEEQKDELSSKRYSNVQEKLEAYREKLEGLESAESSDNYVRVDREVSQLGDLHTETQEKLDEMKKSQKQADRMKMVFIVLGLFVIVVGGAAAYVTHKDSYELELSGYKLDTEGLDVPEISNPLSGEEDDEEEDEEPGVEFK